MANTDDLFSNTKFLDIYPTKYVLRQNSEDSITIDLTSGNVAKERLVTSGDKKQTVGIKAVYGIIQLKSIKYLLCATKSIVVGSIYTKKIYQLTKMEFFPITPDRKVRSSDSSQIKMLQNLFNTKFFYFSDEYDLTNSFQSFIKNSADKNLYNSNFCYNEILLEDFIRLGAVEWISPFISGYVSINYTKIKEQNFDFILISRRDKRRVGLRFMSRGTDLDGNCSNMAEQEQIIILNTNQYDKQIVTIYSHVQTRGSMPFRWRQTPTLKWAPKGYITASDEENQVFCQKHFQDQSRYYQKQTILNLIDKKGTQKMLGEYFEKMMNKVNNKNIRYIWFDFHAECKKMRYDKLSNLLNQIPEELEKYGYFHIQYQKNKPTDLEIFKTQSGVFRTNCMDCLDRTNVVQSVVSRQIVHKVLHNSNMVPTPSGNPFQAFPDKLEETFRAVWTRNADVMSILYSGTGALKTDFTRTGKRTRQGALQDGKNSIHRYFLNNFFDGAKQDSYSLLLGKLEPKKVKQPAFNPLLLVLVTMFAGYIILNNASKSYLHPLFLDDKQLEQNKSLGYTQNRGFSLAVSEWGFLLVGMGVILQLVQKANTFFVSKPSMKC